MTREEAAQGTDGIRPGHYVVRLVRGGPLVGCRIIETDGWWLLLLNGQATSDAAAENPWDLPRMRHIWPAHSIPEDGYDALLAAAASAQPGEPLAQPTERVDWRRAPSLY